MIHEILEKLPPQEGFTFEYEGKKYNRPYETITIDGVRFDGLRKTEDRFSLFDSIMESNNTPHGSYLDIGCNIGSFVHYYGKKFEVAEGIERARPIVELGEQVYPELRGKIKIKDLNFVPLKEIVNKSYDVVTLLSVIEYIDNKSDFLKDLYDLTGSMCIIEGHSEDIVPKKWDMIYEDLLKEQPWKVIRRPELTDPGINAPKHSVGRPLWVCVK